MNEILTQIAKASRGDMRTSDGDIPIWDAQKFRHLTKDWASESGIDVSLSDESCAAAGEGKPDVQYMEFRP